MTFPDGFIWGAATSAHQTEGNNVGSDWWHLEHRPGSFLSEPSGDACDSYHRWRDDMRLAAGAGLRAYRFSVEWARIEPAPGAYSAAELAHYRRMIEFALELGLAPMVTLHHFTLPAWLRTWRTPEAVPAFARYCERVAAILDGVGHACLINEPNMVAIMPVIAERGLETLKDGLPVPDPAAVEALIAAHDAGRDVLRRLRPRIALGWSIASQTYHPDDTAADLAARYQAVAEDVFVDAARGDDWIGVQAYTRQKITAKDGRPVYAADPDAPRTLTGWEVYPAALGECVRRTWQRSRLPILVTENGIATGDDAQRVAYTAAALTGLAAAMADGADVRGYYHWSLLDNYEWGSYTPTFGLVAVDRTTFRRTPKPSLAWLGRVARDNRLPKD
ncbi:glycoside hydrolase family 1 protein [Dactylosporangium sp. CA-092794]|uniref:glycoside hydrolase family 1 protein n=1 Tax=Dactylosporangium sp. CA-092794 TaxID=3239929 RepID=UPI003D8A4FD7